MKTKQKHAVFEVNLKVLLRKNGKILLLRYDNDKWTDLPGGRIDQKEICLPLEKIIDREMREELGPAVKYQLGKPLFQYRKYHVARKVYFFITVYEAKYLDGEIKLSSEHTSYQWVDEKAYKSKSKDFSDKEEYRAFREYFN